MSLSRKYFKCLLLHVLIEVLSKIKFELLFIIFLLLVRHLIQNRYDGSLKVITKAID